MNLSLGGLLLLGRGGCSRRRRPGHAEHLERNLTAGGAAAPPSFSSSKMTDFCLGEVGVALRGGVGVPSAVAHGLSAKVKPGSA